MTSRTKDKNQPAAICPECKGKNVVSREGKYNRKTGRPIRPLMGYVLAGVFLVPLAAVLIGMIYAWVAGNPPELLPLLVLLLVFGAPGAYFLVRMLTMDCGKLLKYHCQDCGHRWVTREDGIEKRIHTVKISRPGYMFQRKIPEGLPTAPREAHYTIECEHCGSPYFLRIEKPPLSNQEQIKIKNQADQGVYSFSSQFRCPQCGFLPTYLLKPGRAAGLMISLSLFGGILLMLMIINPPPVSLLVVMIIIFGLPLIMLFFLIIRRLLSNRKLNRERKQKGHPLHPARISIVTGGLSPEKQIVQPGVRFLKKYTKPLPMGKVGTYLEYEAESLAAARRFLAEQDVSTQFLYVEVYTPEGGIGKDLGGSYEFEID